MQHLVITGYGTNSNSKEKAKEEEQVLSNHVTIQEINDLDADIELASA